MPTTIQPLTVTETAIAGLVILTPKSVHEDRGTVREFFRLSAFDQAGFTGVGRFRQINVTETVPGAIRGMHAESMYKLVGVVAGSAFVAWVDLRTGPGFGTLVTAQMHLGVQALVPPGVANGFQATGDLPCQYLYAFDDEWQPAMDGKAITPLDPDLAIPWPIAPDAGDPTSVSAKDGGAPTLAELRASAERPA